MATIPRPASATSSSPAGQSKTLSMKAVFSSLELPFLPEATLERAEGQGPGDPGLAQADQPLEGAPAPGAPVAVAPAGLGELPDGQGDQADGEHPEEEPPRRLLGDRLQGAGLVRLGPAAEGDPHRQVGDQQVDDAVGDQADPAQGLDRAALGGLHGRPLGPPGLVPGGHQPPAGDSATWSAAWPPRSPWAPAGPWWCPWPSGAPSRCWARPPRAR